MGREAARNPSRILGADYTTREECAMARRGLTDGEWARLEPLLPRRRRKGRPPKSHRLILDTLLWLGRTGCRSGSARGARW
jgi:hypothetical protein